MHLHALGESGETGKGETSVGIRQKVMAKGGKDGRLLVAISGERGLAKLASQMECNAASGKDGT